MSVDPRISLEPGFQFEVKLEKAVIIEDGGFGDVFGQSETRGWSRDCHCQRPRGPGRIRTQSVEIGIL